MKAKDWFYAAGFSPTRRHLVNIKTLPAWAHNAYRQGELHSKTGWERMSAPLFELYPWQQKAVAVLLKHGPQAVVSHRLLGRSSIERAMRHAAAAGVGVQSFKDGVAPVTLSAKEVGEVIHRYHAVHPEPNWAALEARIKSFPLKRPACGPTTGREPYLVGVDLATKPDWTAYVIADKQSEPKPE